MAHAQELRFVWLEITGRCQLFCDHCYASSGPAGTHGQMIFDDWVRVIDQAAGLGVADVQFIGGEPTLHPHLPALVGHALAQHLNVEVFTNLVKVTEPLWETFSQPGVSLATSFYSDDQAEHDLITTRPGSYTKTRANIAEAIRRSIPLRTGVIDMLQGQRVDGALTELERLGVTSVGTDQMRQVGRGERDQAASVDQLCGRCASGVLAVSPDGSVWPCVFSRWLPVGNVRTDGLAAILNGTAVAEVRAMLGTHFAAGDVVAPQLSPKNPRNPEQSKQPCKPATSPCHPQCGPACQPNCSPRCSPSCGPCAPSKRCWPDYR